MCLAIYKPSALKIPEKNLRAGFEANSDGCGIAWAADGKMHVEKGMLDWNSFYGLYLAAEEHSCLIHFRKATHGHKSEKNCHPFLFKDHEDNDLALIHNGVIPIKCVEDGYSDTWHFVNKVLGPLVKSGTRIDNQSLSWFVRVSIGSDKVAVMDRFGGVIIFNEEKGHWEDTDGPDGKKGKVWYSNLCFRNHRTNYGTGSGTGCNTNQSSISNHSRQTVAEEDTNAADWEGYGFHPDRVSEGANTPLSGDIEIATDENRKPGCMTEYGWYDTEIETEIEKAKTDHKLTREDAIIHVFNNA